jgi:broad-specificity NMP kinase
MSIEEIEARRAARKEGIAKARREQYEKDIVEVDKLEVEHGDDRVSVLETSSFVAGLPTVVVVKTPQDEYFRRYRQKARRARKQNGNVDTVAMGDAADELAECCVVYPDDKEVYTRMKKEWPSIHDNAIKEAIRLGEAKEKD